MSRPPGLTSCRAAAFSFRYFNVTRSTSRFLGASLGGMQSRRLPSESCFQRMAVLDTGAFEVGMRRLINRCFSPRTTMSQR